MERIGVPFEFAIAASEIGSYKPARGHWMPSPSARLPTKTCTCTSPPASITTSRPRERLGIPAIWINRLGDESDLPRAAELSDLRGLADALDRAELGQ